MLLKQVPTLNKDYFNNSINKFRQSIMDNSGKSKNSKINKDLKDFNPDMRSSIKSPGLFSHFSNKFDNEITPGGESKENQSAPTKLNQPIGTPVHKNSFSQAVEIYEESNINLMQRQITKEKVIELKTHEELLFHYLSILAVLPKRRGDILSILDIYGVRSAYAKQTKI